MSKKILYSAAVPVVVLGSLALTASARAASQPVAGVTGLHVTVASATSLAVTWHEADSSAKVRVQVYNADTLQDTWDSAYKGGIPAGGSAVTAIGLQPGTAYVLRADASDGSANPGWTVGQVVYTQASGAAGTPGPKGDPGVQGPSGVVSVLTKDLGAVASVPTGGRFAANKTLAGTVALKAGTYLISVNAKATPDVSSPVAVFPQFFVYNGPAAADFSNNLLNAGAGALATDSTSIDSYYSGSGVITLTADSTLNVYAFGYDSDRGAGTYALDDLTVTAVQLQPAS